MPPLSVACRWCGKVTAPGVETEAHAENCAFRGECTLCFERIAIKDMSSHLAGTCAAAMLTCQYCAARVNARDIDTHMHEFHRSRKGVSALTPRFWQAEGAAVEVKQPQLNKSA
jgi:hypothetical protein